MTERLPELELSLLRALRNAKASTLSGLAVAVGLPRTNFGRPLSSRVEEQVERLVRDGLVDEKQGRYRISKRGRRRLAQLALGE